MIGLSRLSFQQRLLGRRVMSSVLVSATTPLIETLPLTLDSQTSSITIRLKRPTTNKPLNWDATGTVTVTIKAVRDGIPYSCTGKTTGGIRVNHLDQEIESYSLTFVPTWGYLDGPLQPPKRLGEGSSTYHAVVEITRSSGIIETELDISTTQGPVPDVPFTNSVAFDAATDGQEIGGDGVLSLSHTATGSNLAAFAASGHANIPPNTSLMTYDGSSMTELWDAGFSSAYGHAGYRLAGIGTGAKTVTNTLSDTAGYQFLGVITMTGVDQTTVVGTPQTTTGFSDPATVTVTGVGADDMVVDALHAINGTISVGADQTLRNTEDYATDNAHFRMSTQPGSAGGVMSWAVGSPDTYGYGAVHFIAATGGGGRTTKNTRSWPLGTEIGMNWRV